MSPVRLFFRFMSLAWRASPPREIVGLVLVATVFSAYANGWASLTPAQHRALAPLAAEWDRLPPDNQRKWLELAGRFDGLSADQKARVQERMAEWARMTPQQRGSARLNFQESRQLTPGDRQSQWDAYKALPEDQRQALSAKAQRTSPVGAEGGKQSLGPALRAPTLNGVTPKDRLVPSNPASGIPSRLVGPTMVAPPAGATVSPVSRLPQPPAHQPAGVPKITVHPSQVNRTTLLPLRPEAPERSASSSKP